MSERKKWLKYLPVVLTLLLIAGVGYVGLFLMSIFQQEDVTPRKVVQQITVITPPPPPPPPPPEEIKEPEVEEEVVEEEIDEAPPEEGPEEVASEDLGLDADGAAGSDDFGLVARKGGRGLLGGGYGSLLKSEINKAMLKDEKVRALAYRAKITLWMEDDGSFARYEVEMLEGTPETKVKLERFLASLGGIGKAKPFEEASTWFSFRISSVL